MAKSQEKHFSHRGVLRIQMFVVLISVIVGTTTVCGFDKCVGTTTVCGFDKCHCGFDKYHCWYYDCLWF